MRWFQCVVVICVLLSPYLCSAQSKCSSAKCIDIYQCNPVLDMIKNAPKPLPSATVKQLQSYQCGSDGKTVKVCCPNQITTEMRQNLIDITEHKNYNLLPNSDCGVVNVDDRIVGGEIAELYEFPFMALLFYLKANGRIEHKCAGSIISDRYILTAAHCVTNLGTLKLVKVRLGEYNITSNNDCEEFDGYKRCLEPFQEYEIEEHIPHPDYSTKLFANDIAILRLKTKIVYKDHIKPICLPTSKALADADIKRMTVTGWGVTEKGVGSNVLLKVNLQVVEQNSCSSSYHLYSITDRQFCAGGTLLKDSCNGDSGGPLQAVRPIKNNIKYVQYGIVSIGPTACGKGGTPGLYTRITSYLNWILNNMKP